MFWVLPQDVTFTAGRPNGAYCSGSLKQVCRDFFGSDGACEAKISRVGENANNGAKQNGKGLK